MKNQQILLLTIGLGCLLLTWYSIQKNKDEQLPYANQLEWFLPTLGGGAYALNFLFKLAN